MADASSSSWKQSEKRRGQERALKVSISPSVVSNPMDCSRPGSPVHGILQARILEWVAISSSKERYEAGEKIAGRSRAGENRG